MAVLIISGIYGLLVGSFLNVVIHRVPLGESVTAPRSRCPECSKSIVWYDNIPVLSWLWLRARCRHCDASIHVRYVAVELLTAAVFVIVAVSIETRWVLPAYLVFAGVLIALSGIDMSTRTLPNRILYPAGFVGAALLAVGAVLDREAPDLGWAALGTVIGFGVLFVIWFVAPGGMGYGDVRLSAYLGLHLGYLSIGHVVFGLFLGFLFGAVTGLGLLVFSDADRKAKIPFGPYLAAGALVAVVIGDSVIDAYLGI